MRVLHVGCGMQHLPPELFPGCEEVRLDIDPTVSPDVVASITDMGDVGEFDALYSAHNLEHLYPQDVDGALREFRRVLKPGGCAVITVPDLEGVAISEDVLFVSPSGPITAIDLLYGFRPALETHPYMAHHNCFTSKTLEAAVLASGFERVQMQRLTDYNLLAVAFSRKAD